MVGQPIADEHGLGIMGVSLEDLNVVLTSFHRIAQLFSIQVAQGKVRSSLTGITSQNFLEFVGGIDEVIRLSQKKGEVIPGIQGFGPERQRSVVGSERSR